MKSKGMVLLLAGLLVLGLVGGAAAQSTNNWGYSADVTISGVKPFTDSGNVTFTSPASLGGTKSFAGGKTVGIKINVLDAPDGVTGDEALHLLTLSSDDFSAPNQFSFTEFNQSKTFTVNITVLDSTAIGDYQFQFQADPPPEVMEVLAMGPRYTLP